MKPSLFPNRRTFLRNTAATAGGIFLPNLLIGQEGGVKKINVAGIGGAGGKGASDVGISAKGANIVAICDIDRERLKQAQQKYPDAKMFESFREMFDAMGDKIDMCTVSTPDHAHYPAAMEAIKRGKHVCVQKPLVNRIWEANQLHEAAKKKGVKTNMGNQGHTGKGIRFLNQWISEGIVGNVKEIHVWTNRPIWPQGNEAKEKYTTGTVPKIKEKKKGPDGKDIMVDTDQDLFNWENWLAQCPSVPFTNGLHPFAWRGHREYGAGAMGDMGCHLLDGPFWACGLGEPYKMEAECDELTDVSWPKSSHVVCYFKTEKYGEIKLHWYEGSRKPERPAELEAERDWDKIKGGFILRGDEGVILNTDDYCGSPRLIPSTKMASFLGGKSPELKLEPALAEGEPQLELIRAIEQNKVCGSNFDYSVPLTKLCLLGNLAIATPGKVINWDSAKQESDNADANKLITRAAYREGWDYSAAKI
ncbi:MAG TPA: Gfo/Idh/MocA family oxidoreductase [Prosthecobacter sp.]|nr:Gfo/Idh/MocA family oxidoreductase [Prosthecobacter sp.]